MFWFATLQTRLGGLVSWKEKKEFLVSESTNSDINAIANSAGLDKNNHNEQSDQSQHCLPS